MLAILVVIMSVSGLFAARAAEAERGDPTRSPPLRYARPASSRGRCRGVPLRRRVGGRGPWRTSRAQGDSGDRRVEVCLGQLAPFRVLASRGPGLRRRSLQGPGGGRVPSGVAKGTACRRGCPGGALCRAGDGHGARDRRPRAPRPAARGRRGSRPARPPVLGAHRCRGIEQPVTVWLLHAIIDWDLQLPAVALPAVVLAGLAAGQRGGGARWPTWRASRLRSALSVLRLRRL